MKIDKLKIMYFLGIGGIGMSALARYCNSLGIEIHGYDLTPTKLTTALIAEGMNIHFAEDIDLIPKNTDLVVLTPAIPENNLELKYFENNDYEIVKRSQLLGILSENSFMIAVAGTHGKTSISSMIAHLLLSAGKNVTALIGGVMNNYKSNAIIGKTTDYLVLEADEFDRSFLHLKPNISVVSSMDDDHLDIYKTSSELKKTFIQFALKTEVDGVLFYQEDLMELETLNLKKAKYGFEHASYFRAENIRIVNGSFVFDFYYGNKDVKAIIMQVPGRHYIENALAAAAVGVQIGLSGIEIKQGLETFKGVERRFEFKVKSEKNVLIDDYAHHPTEITSSLKAVKELFPEKKLSVVFQPHLFSRTRDFVDGFAESLDIADEIFLLDIYPARELPIEGVSSKIILEKIKTIEKSILSKDDLIKKITTNKPELLVMLGAGDIGLLAVELQKIIEKND